VRFRLGETASAIKEQSVILKSGEQVPADIVVAGIGVRPNTALAEAAGLRVDRGILVNEYLETSSPGIYAAGDVARWPDAATGDAIRIEHWVVAERQGQAAARNMIATPNGDRRRFDAVPFFWSKHYDVTINYVGHAERWDVMTIDGDLTRRDATVSYVLAGRALATATVGRDEAALRSELAMEHGLARQSRVEVHA
jgi:NADPH-dependent 2,4-dienoyl-CoA reductase/sulfur reductase-like enzyme